MKWLLLLSLSIPLQAQTVDKKFVAFNAANFAMTAADIEYTQNCIADHTCYEANPLMGQSRAQMYSVGMGIAALQTWASWYLKKGGGHSWMVAPIVGITTHTLGIGLTLHFKR